MAEVGYRRGDGFDGAPSVVQLIDVLLGATGTTGRAMTTGPEPGGPGDVGKLLAAGLDEAEQALAVAGFSALWDGQLRRPEDLLPGHPQAPDAAALARRGRAELDGDGRLVGIHGLTLRPTRHRLVHHDRTHHTWCAFDTIGIPAALHLDAEAHTDCPACDRPLGVRILAGVPAGGGDSVLWLPGTPAGDLMAEFCSGADLYCSMDHLRLRVGPSVPGERAGLAAAAALGRRAWEDVTGPAGTIGAGP